MEIVAVDLGGTHARFAVATLDGRRVAQLGPETVIRAAEHVSLASAWTAFAAAHGRPLPRAAAIAVAAPADGDTIKMTNNPWVIRPAELPEKLGIDALAMVNDFEAVAQSVAALAPAQLVPLCGPDGPLPADGVVTVLGPGTGLGVAMLVRSAGGDRAVATEGGHMDFAPLDAIDDQILALLRQRHRRVSVERVVAGPALPDIYQALAMIEQRPVAPVDDRTLWTRALEGSDDLAVAALERFCMSLGAVAGDLALAQGAGAVVVAGGLGLRLAAHLPRSGFRDRFVAKGRFEARMAALPVRIVTHPQPGLLGAAAAFAARLNA
ncbi:ROK family protein [Sphingomonas changnyeongensis]|uniref:Glucokinase n=1 Tax=Sphingomonas changnyeongensis TaxID=2698679 RepID=A0A7Z2S6U3_9SPHN|nr:ROK family protein [Sphingomonas changnyeongensis]QHL89656.1 ROK family protein [Sphingomonas changnyeongensis]